MSKDVAKKPVRSEESRLDAKLLDLADQGYSGLEMEEETGIPAAQCMVRVRELLNNRDWLTELERQKLNVIALGKVKNSLMQRVNSRHATSEDLEVFVKATKVMGELLDKTNEITDEQLAVITTKQAQALVRLMGLAFDAAVARLEEMYPELDTAEVVDVFNNGLRAGVREIEAANPVE